MKEEDQLEGYSGIGKTWWKNGENVDERQQIIKLIRLCDGGFWNEILGAIDWNKDGRENDKCSQFEVQVCVCVVWGSSDKTNSHNYHKKSIEDCRDEWSTLLNLTHLVSSRVDSNLGLSDSANYVLFIYPTWRFHGSESLVECIRQEITWHGRKEVKRALSLDFSWPDGQRGGTRKEPRFRERRPWEELSENVQQNERC